MKQLWYLAALAAAVCSISPLAAAPVTQYFSDLENDGSGLRGLHINRSSNDLTPHGISLDLDGVPIWDFGIDYRSHDLVLAFSHATDSDQVRLRPDTGQLELGPMVGHPVTENQVNITAGTPDKPLDGIGVGVFGNRGIHLYQKVDHLHRVKISFDNVFQIGTDYRMNGTPDFWFYNNQTNQVPIYINPYDQVTMGYGVEVGGMFRHAGTHVGFYGKAPIRRPVITGSRTDGTAIKNLFSKLHEMGLIIDNTTE